MAVPAFARLGCALSTKRFVAAPSRVLHIGVRRSAATLNTNHNDGADISASSSAKAETSHDDGPLPQARLPACKFVDDKSEHGVPDPTRGYDVAKYESLWAALQKEGNWPSVQRFSVVGPASEDFTHSVEACVLTVVGCKPVRVAVIPKTKWQSVRLDVHCTSPDDFCALHSGLKNLDGVKYIL
eukprot:TRINITY_DN61540_c0_g1_i1.p1 TRINITY_DN61540_c0_g1~~TRINITY_DN61540_c0_g1_i1.p1  ORF type:complete len:184 (-),score=20.00 TRINITY_DN61540_c0_g1_i1:110-661(-)